METVTVDRTIPGDPDEITAAMNDLEPFMAAAGFDEVSVDGDQIFLENDVGLLTISLTLRRIESDAALAYEQVDGIFQSMRTDYTVHSEDGATTVTAETDFELDVGVVGPMLDSTVIARQRRKELTAQLDYLERSVE